MSTLLYVHSLLRWIVLLCLLLTVYRSYGGLRNGRVFSRSDDRLRHWTATAAHIQMVVGIILYTKSPVVKYFWSNFNYQDLDTLFFGLIHIALMLTAVGVITVGSALAKRRLNDAGKFNTVFTWFTIALAIILVAIPWPFSPLSSRPYFR